MNHLQNPVSLEEKALIQVAIDRCQANDFKETVLCLEKPVYGAFISYYEDSIFVSDPEKLAKWPVMMKQDEPEYSNLASSCFISDEERIENWDAALNKQCQKLTERLPCTLKHGVQVWMNRMALEYLSYCRRQEALFGLSRYFLMDFVTREDWNESGRVDEERLAERLVKDERLTILQRYRIACVYCLRADSRDCVLVTLWKQLTSEEKASLLTLASVTLASPKLASLLTSPSSEKNRLVLLWSYYMDRGRDKKVMGRNKYLWRYAIEQAVADGNRVALMPCWRFLKERLHQDLATKMAFRALRLWFHMVSPDQDSYMRLTKGWRANLVTVKSSSDKFFSAREFNLPSYYSDLLCFFLSEMSKADQLTFFEKVFQDKQAHYILECFLDWPHQDYFLPTIKKLWGILPKYNYGRSLLLLASKYSGDYDWKIPRTMFYTKEDRHYDYQSLLFQLWEETPEDYKRYLFTDKPFSSNPGWEKLNEGQMLLLRLLKRCPFQEADERFFKRVFNELTADEKKAFIYSEESGESIWSTLTWTENYSLLNWIFKKCLLEKEVPNLKKQFVQSDSGENICFYMLKGNREESLKNLINWSFESNEERRAFKEKLIYSNRCLDACESLLHEGQFSEVERMMEFCLDSEEMKGKFKAYLARDSIPLLENLDFEKLGKIVAWSFESNEERRAFKEELIYCNRRLDACKLLLCEGQFSEVERMMDFCLDSEEMKEKFKANLARASSIPLLENLDFEKLDKIVAWCSDSEEKLVMFKKEIVFREEIMEIHYEFMLEKQWEKVKTFYEWFGLSPDEIRKLKKETAFSERSTQDMGYSLYDEVDNICFHYLPYLRWCLTDESMIASFKVMFENFLFYDPREKYNVAKERLDHLIEQLLSSFKKDTENKKQSEMSEEEPVVSSKPIKSEEKSINQLTYLVETRGEKRAYEVTEEESHSLSKQITR